MNQWLLALAIAEKVAVVVGAAGLWFAYNAYRGQKVKDRTILLADQISFFRLEVISRVLKFEKHLLDNGRLLPGSIPDDMKIAGVAIDVSRDDFKPNQENNIAHQEKTNEVYEAKVLQTELANVLEEFSIKIISAEGEESPHLKSVRHAFVHAVDRCSVWLMKQRKQLTKNDSFSSILRLYQKWEPTVVR